MIIQTILLNEICWTNGIPWNTPEGIKYIKFQEEWLGRRKYPNYPNEDTFFLFLSKYDYIVTKTKSSDIKDNFKIFDYIEIAGRKVLQFNYPIKEEIYPVEEKNRTSVVICGNYATPMLIHIGNVEKDEQIMKEKLGLISRSILDIGRKSFGNRIEISKGKGLYNGSFVRHDITIDKKKISGIDTLIDKKKFMVCSIIQNKFTEQEEKTIYQLMTGDPYWDISNGKRIGITGTNFELLNLLEVLQNNADEIYLK